jgi:hypothetical protein
MWNRVIDTNDLVLYGMVAGLITIILMVGIDWFIFGGKK